MDFWRFVFAIVVVLLHSVITLSYLKPTSTPFSFGAIAVEFFLLLSGFFMMKSLESLKTNPKGTIHQAGYLALRFSWKKIKFFFPYTFLPIIAIYIAYAVALDWSASEILSQFAYSIYELLLLPMTGIRVTVYNSILWYLSCFIIAIPLLSYLMLRFEDFFKYIFIFLAPLMLYGYMNMTYNSITKWNVWLGFTYVGVLRVIAGLCLGCVCYLAYKKLKEVHFTKIGLWAITIVHAICFSVSIGFMYFKIPKQLDFLVVILFMMAVITTFLQKSYISKLLNRRCFGILGKISLPLYTSHMLMRRLMPMWFPSISFSKALIIYISFSLILAVLLYFFVEAIKWLHPWKRLKKLLINEI